LHTVDLKSLKIEHDKDEEIIRDIQTELFQKNGKGWFRIISGSMYPLIEISDRVLVKKINPSEIKLRDIIFFRNDNTFVTHRVIKLVKNDRKIMILQKGDANNHASLIPPEIILGKVKTIEKRGKFLDLDSYQGRAINGFLGWQNFISYRLGLSIAPIKQQLRDKPGFTLVMPFYQILKKPLRYMHRMMVRIVFLPTFFR